LKDIEGNFPEDVVAERFDEEIFSGNWIDSYWKDDYESEYEWYVEHGRGEAESAVIGGLIDWWKEKYGFEKELDKYNIKIYEGIREIYYILSSG